RVLTSCDAVNTFMHLQKREIRPNEVPSTLALVRPRLGLLCGSYRDSRQARRRGTQFKLCHVYPHRRNSRAHGGDRFVQGRVGMATGASASTHRVPRAVGRGDRVVVAVLLPRVATGAGLGGGADRQAKRRFRNAAGRRGARGIGQPAYGVWRRLDGGRRAPRRGGIKKYVTARRALCRGVPCAGLARTRLASATSVYCERRISL